MKTQTALPDGFNLLSPDTFLNGHPFTAYDALRTANPVHYHPGDNDMEPFWVLTRHQAIRELSCDSERFTTTEGFNLTTAGKLGSNPGIVQAIGRNIIGYDRPDHTEFRKALMPAFSSKNLAVMEARTSAYVTELLDGLDGRTEIDFVSELAERVPIRVLCNILGIPPEDEAKILTWTNRMVGAQDPDFAANPAVAFEAYMEVFAYGKWLVEQRRQDPQDDLMSLLANADFDGVPISDATRDGMCATLIAAGNETTRNSLSGSILLMSEFPQQRQRLAAEPELMPNAVAELLRRYTPIIHMVRTATQDLEIDGQAIAAGEKVAMLYGAANHDPEQYENPYRLDSERPNASSHLAFGAGIHLCLGARLAQMEIRIVLQALLSRYPNIEITQQPNYLRSNFVHDIKTLPVRLA